MLPATNTAFELLARSDAVKAVALWQNGQLFKAASAFLSHISWT